MGKRHSGNGSGNGLTGNHLLDALPAADRSKLLAQLSGMNLPMKTVIFEPGEKVDAVHFPLDGVISLVTSLEDGAIVEVATVGNEGIVGVPMVRGGSLVVRAISQVPGRSLWMSASAFLTESERRGAFRDLVEHYLQ